MITLTIFTPVYNRKDLILELYQSLEKQSCKEFVWSIVDDGSTDGLPEIIDSIKETASFKIFYTYQINQGKHIAHNTGLDICTTDLFMCVDSDDRLCDDAVEIILKTAESHKNEELLGFYYRKVDTQGNISGGSFKLKSNYVGIRDIYHVYGFAGELAIVLYTKYAKSFRFPSFENEYFVSELVYYNRLNNLAPMLWIDKTIYIFEYQEDGYTNNSKQIIVNNPYGAAYGYLSESVYATKALDRIKNYAEYKAICRIFKLDTSLFPNIYVGIIERVASLAMMKHYYHIFQTLKEEQM